MNSTTTSPDVLSATGTYGVSPQTTVQQEPKPRHNCYLCDRSYERTDHLNRHLKTHNNERSHRCPECGKGFNRADLLNRHRAAHAKVTQGEPMRKRTEKACQACIRAKTKCDEARPCKRCKKRDMVCEDTPERSEADDRRSSFAPSMDGQISSQMPMHTPTMLEPAQAVMGAQVPAVDAMPAPDVNSFPDFSISDDLGPLTFDFGYPEFFENIMMPVDPGMGAPEAVMMPPDVSNFTSDLDFGAADIDFSFLANGLARTPAPPEQLPPIAHNEGSIASMPTPGSEAGPRSEALSKSPWSWNHWIPPRGMHAFSDHPELDVREDRVNAADQLTSPSARQNHHCSLDYEARDRMMRVVTQCTVQKLSVPSFPSLQLLEDLIDVFLLQDSYAIDSQVHTPTFDAKHTRTEFLLAMVAKGAGFIALPPIWKMGLVIQEVVRLAVADLFEKDNSNTRDLFSVQATLLWVNIGIWSGFRRQTEIAASFLQPPVTMLTWSNAFSRFRYKSIVPSLEDSGVVLEQKWKDWAEQESWKRMVFDTFIQDSQVMLVQMRCPLISPAQMLLPVPAPRDLWTAPNAEAWRSAFIAKYPSGTEALPSVIDIIGDPHLLGTHGGSLDKRLCQLLVAHAIAHEVFEYRQQALISRHLGALRRRDRGLAHLSRLRDLYEDLTNFLTYCDLDPGTPPEIIFTLQFLMMKLHVSLDDIQLFSGRAGEEEARKVYPQVRAWTEESDSRTAVWHAGQLFRVARGFESTRLRDFYAVAVHHAALTLWVYGMVVSNTNRQSGLQTPVVGPASASHTPNGQRSRQQQAPIYPMAAASSRKKLYLDGSDEKAGRAFAQLKLGVPGLQQLPPAKDGSAERSDPAPSPSAFCPLYNSKGVMSVAAAILRGNFPRSKEGLPPLVENLANLMDDLGKLSN